jgi:glycine C-acetyltransferase
MKSAIKLFQTELDDIKSSGMYKEERILTTPQSKKISTTLKPEVINMCANNYLGLSDNAEIIEAAKASYEKWGFGLSSVRFICGTQDIHKQLEKKMSEFLRMDDTILYTSCFDANTGLFETLLKEEDAIISDEMNHASIIDGVRLCKAKRFRYKNNNMEDLKTQLEAAKDCRIKLIVTDGVFSMDGIIADLKSVCDLAEQYDALVMVDDSHAVGFVGETGRGTHEYNDVFGRIDIMTGTFGKALGGASGGYTSARKEIVDLLRQRSRPYLFSNTLAPSIVCGSLKTLDMLSSSTDKRDALEENTKYYRALLKENNFDIIDGVHPIVPIMFYDEKKATEMAAKMYEMNVYVIGFTYPVVPKGKARIRTQVSASHTKEELKYVVDCFIKARG